MSLFEVNIIRLRLLYIPIIFRFFFMLITFLDRGKSSESSRDVYLSNVNCLGVEDSVIACEGSGWRNVNQSLCNHENDAGVYCYKSGKWID